MSSVEWQFEGNNPIEERLREKAAEHLAPRLWITSGIQSRIDFSGAGILQISQSTSDLNHIQFASAAQILIRVVRAYRVSRRKLAWERLFGPLRIHCCEVTLITVLVISVPCEPLFRRESTHRNVTWINTRHDKRSLVIQLHSRFNAIVFGPFLLYSQKLRFIA